jgi:transcriptional regulator with XRE-family HTH domain
MSMVSTRPEPAMRELPIPSCVFPIHAGGMNLNPVEIAARIKERREALHLSQGELSRRAGVRPETISRYEGDKNKPRLAELIAIATALATSIDYLVGLSDDPAPSRPSQAALLDAPTLEIINRVLVDLRQDDPTSTWVREKLEASAYPGASYHTLWSYANDLLLGRSGRLRVPSPTPEKPATRTTAGRSIGRSGDRR